MWQYNQTVQNDELMHYGVVGMKWGRRKARINTNKANNYRAKAKGVNGEIRELNSYDRAAKKGGNGSGKYASFVRKKQLIRATDRRDNYEALAKRHDKKATKAQAKADRKEGLNKTYKKIKSEASIEEKLVYNPATRKKAAKYVVDKNMSVADANKKAKGVAWRNTAIMVGAYSAVSIASLMYSKAH